MPAAGASPLAMTSGDTPRMKANDVMRIGRKRSRAASMAASRSGTPRPRISLANSTIRMAFLAASPTTVIEADLEVDVARQTPKPDAEQRAQRAERNAEQHRERDGPALVLGREHQKHDYEAEPEDQSRLSRGGPLLERLAGVATPTPCDSNCSEMS